MKKLLSVMMVFILVSTHLAIADPASAGKKTDSSITVSINGETLSEKGIVKNGRTFLPVAVIGKKLDLPIEWNGSTKTVVIKGSSTVEVKIGSKQALVNGEVVTLDVPAFVSGGRTMLPVSFIAKHLGISVNYDAKAKMVSIDAQGAQQTTPDPQQTTQPEQPSKPDQSKEPPQQTSKSGKILKVVVDGTEVPFEVKDGKTYVPFGALKNSLKIEKISIEPFGNIKMLYFKNGELDIGFYASKLHGFWQDDAPIDDESVRLYKSGDNWMIPLQKIVKVFKLDYEANNGIFSVDSSNPGYVIISGSVDPWNDDSVSEFHEWLEHGTVKGVKYKGWDKDQGGPIQPY